MKTTLDRIDAGIVAELQNNGRLSNKELAGKVGLAPSSCLERVRRLERRGILKGYTAIFDHEALGIGLQAMIAVRMRTHTQETVLGFMDELEGLPEVLSVYYTTGTDDFLVHVGVRDAAHLRELVLEAFTAQSDVSNVNTSLIFEQRTSGRLPIYSGEG